MLTSSSLPEDDDYEPCVGVVMRVCFIDGFTRMELKADKNFLMAIKKFHRCYDEEAKTCDADILKHFIAYMNADEEHFKDGNGKFGKMLEGIPAPRVEL